MNNPNYYSLTEMSGFVDFMFWVLGIIVVLGILYGIAWLIVKLLKVK